MSEYVSYSNHLSLLLTGSFYNCSDYRGIITDSNWTVFCPPTEEVAFQSILIINGDLPMISPFEEIGMVMVAT